jgi:hypothetical protein
MNKESHSTAMHRANTILESSKHEKWVKDAVVNAVELFAANYITADDLAAEISCLIHMDGE